MKSKSLNTKLTLPRFQTDAQNNKKKVLQSTKFTYVKEKDIAKEKWRHRPYWPRLEWYDLGDDNAVVDHQLLMVVVKDSLQISDGAGLPSLLMGSKVSQGEDD